MLANQGKSLRLFTKLVHTQCQKPAEHPRLKQYAVQLSALNRQWGEVTMAVGGAAMANPDEVGAAAMDYLMFSGYTALGYFLVAHGRGRAGQA